MCFIQRHAYTKFLKYVYDVRRGEYDISKHMESLMLKYTTPQDAVVLARSLLSELKNVEDPYVARLQGGIEPASFRRIGLVSDRSRVEMRMMNLAESVKTVFSDILDEDD